MNFSPDSFLKNLLARDKHYEVRITTTRTEVFQLDAKTQQDALDKIRKNPSFYITNNYADENQTIITEWEDDICDRN